MTVRRVAVLGAGTMGSRIAAHFANAGIPALLLDLTEEAARKGLETAAKQRPVAFFTEEAMRLVTPGSFEKGIPSLGDYDWIIEAVTENLDIKRALWQRIDQSRKADAILSTNTSGIPLASIAAGFSSDFRERFLGTHFFNPPRYLHLLEVIPGPDTDEDLLEFVQTYADRRLGKGVVLCKDTPNFIANRIGSFFGSTALQLASEGGYTVEEVDALTGPLIGLPKSASFRLFDIVGLDVWAYVSKNLYELVPDDRWRERFQPPPFMQEMLSRGWLGEKAGQGFYKRVGKEKEIHAIDMTTFEYHPAAKVRFASLETIRTIEDLPQRLQALVALDDRAGSFLWKLFRDVMLYSAERIPEISDRTVEIDRAMKWGYAHALGPFELWDALGFEETARRMEREGCELPANIQGMLSAGASRFYQAADMDGEPRTEYFDFPSNDYELLEPRPGIVVLSDAKRARGVVASNPGASLIDVGDGVLCVEFHSKMNSLGDDAIEMILAGLTETESNFEAMIIANQGENFSVGANLMLVLLAAQEGDWDELDLAVQRFQQCNMAIKYAAKPVVAAPFNRTLGGGAEIVLHSARAQASAELYMGLVEVGVGVIPAAGGCKEMLLRLRDPRKVFELIGFAKVSTSAHDAQKLGLLHRQDGISMNPERLIGDAKTVALSLTASWSPGAPRDDIKVGGESAFAALKIGAWSMKQAGHISDYDMVIAEKLANILSGGRLTGEQTVSEQYLLDLEREAFLSLCGNPQTLERIQYMLKNGKPLRN